MMIYYKNAFLRKYMKPGQPLHTLVMTKGTKIAMDLEMGYMDIFGDPDAYKFDHFNGYVKDFCE